MPDDPDDEDEDESGDPDAPVEMPIEDALDLHTFAPGDVRELVADYLELAAEKGFREVRIIHGKGKGTLRRTVHAVLDRHPRVVSYRLGGEGGGAWGATFVTLGNPRATG